MQDTLDLPAIQPELLDEAPPPAPKTDIAVAASQALDLAKVDLTDVALAQFGKWQDAVAEARKKLDGTVHDLSTQTKIDEAKSLRWRLIGIPRAQARTTCKELKSKLAKVSRAIGEEETKIVAAWDEAETLITPQIEAREKALEEEREAARVAREKAAREEAERKQAMEDGIATIAGYVQKAQGKSAADIAKGIAIVRDTVSTDRSYWGEYLDRATNMLASTLQTLEAMHAAAVKAEADAAELEALRREKAEREAREAAERAAKAEQDRREEEARAQAQRDAEAAAEAKRIAELPMADVREAAAEAAPITQDAQESGSLPGDAPAPCASNEAESATASPSGDVEPAAHADTSAATPIFEILAPRVIYAEPEPESDPLMDAAIEAVQLATHARLAFAGRFPSHPKPDVAWWDGLRAHLDRLETALAQAGVR